MTWRALASGRVTPVLPAAVARLLTRVEAESPVDLCGQMVRKRSARGGKVENVVSHPVTFVNLD